MKVSFVATVINEELTIKAFLNSIFSQSKIPDEVIIVDGGSTDGTLDILSRYKVSVISKKGNRSVGRNEAIREAKNEIIACSDSGCILDKDWVKNIVKPFNNPKIDVVAGYYKGIARTVFEKSLIPYVLVMPDKVNPDTFLPATRSMAFKKSIWKKAGGFPEEFSNNEDYVFAKNLKRIGARIVFEKSAIANWIPRKNIKEAFVMFYRFALGDAEAKIFRPKVGFIFQRYIIGLALVLLFLDLKSSPILYAVCILLVLYILWSIFKNFKYVKDLRGIIYLPLIQFASDLAVIYGSIVGLLVKSK